MSRKNAQSLSKADFQNHSKALYEAFEALAPTFPDRAELIGQLEEHLLRIMTASEHEHPPTSRLEEIDRLLEVAMGPKWAKQKEDLLLVMEGMCVALVEYRLSTLEELDEWLEREQEKMELRLLIHMRCLDIDGEPEYGMEEGHCHL